MILNNIFLHHNDLGAIESHPEDHHGDENRENNPDRSGQCMRDSIKQYLYSMHHKIFFTAYVGIKSKPSTRLSVSWQAFLSFCRHCCWKNCSVRFWLEFSQSLVFFISSACICNTSRTLVWLPIWDFLESVWQTKSPRPNRVISIDATYNTSCYAFKLITCLVVLLLSRAAIEAYLVNPANTWERRSWWWRWIMVLHNDNRDVTF